MAQIVSQLTLNNILILEVDDNPTLGSGTPGAVCSIAFANVDNKSTFWIKNSNVDTDWVQMNATPNYYRFGFVPTYVNGSQIFLSPGCYLDNTNKKFIFSDTNTTISLATSGTNGLDTGSEASSTWYYVWVIAKEDGTTSAVFSTSYTSPTLPNGYVYCNRLRFAVKNDTNGNIIPFFIGSGWPNSPTVYYNTSFSAGFTDATMLFIGNSPTSFTTLNCSNFIPPISNTGVFYIQTAGQIKIRANGETHKGKLLGGLGDSGNVIAQAPTFNLDNVICKTNNNQQIQHMSPGFQTYTYIAVCGYEVNVSE